MPGKLKNSTSGFSLVELSIVLLIISIVLGMTLTFGVYHTQKSKHTKTEQQLDEILQAISVFVEQNQRLPCPALGTLTVTDVNFGRESPTCANSAGISVTAGSPLRVGMVPVRSLGLPDNYLFDGWSRRISYIADQRFANQGGNFLLNTQLGVISIGGAVGGNNIAAPEVGGNTPVLVVISYGENGYGAWPQHGGTARVNLSTSTADERENAHVGSAFDGIFIQRPLDGTFDDIVRFQTKNQVRERIAAVPETVCSVAATVRTTTPAAICQNTTYNNSGIACTHHFTELEAIITRLCAQ